jgi:hypothetical protein
VATELPFVDEHAIEIDAPPDAVWNAVCHVAARSFDGGLTGRVSGVLGCVDRETRGRIDQVGSSVAGFHVARAERPVELALEGAHRFARYALVFRIDEVGANRSRLRAETRAKFPGARGRAYRALVIGTRGHVVAVKRLLRAVGTHAERAATTN